MAHHSKETNDTHFCGVALQNPLNGFNIGAALRACGCFDSSFLVVQGTRYKERNSDFKCMDTEFARKRLPMFLGVPSIVPFISFDTDVVIIERTKDAIALPEFQHPRRCMYLYGPEDGSVDASMIPDGIKKHHVYIPSNGSLNLSACVYMTLYDRKAKEGAFKVSDTTCEKCGSSHYKKLSELNEAGEATYHCNACGFEWTLLQSA